MKIVLNNNLCELKGDSISVADLLKEMKFTFPLIVVKVNNRLIKKDEYQETLIKDGDQVEAIHLISGG